MELGEEPKQKAAQKTQLITKDSTDKHIHKPQKVSNIQQSWCFNTAHSVNSNN